MNITDIKLMLVMLSYIFCKRYSHTKHKAIDVAQDSLSGEL